MATHSSILVWRIPWTEDSAGLQSMGHKESDTTDLAHMMPDSLPVVQNAISFLKKYLDPLCWNIRHCGMIEKVNSWGDPNIAPQKTPKSLLTCTLFSSFIQI